MTAPEYDSVPGSFDPNIDDDPYFDSHADIDNAYGLGEHADVDEMNHRREGGIGGLVAWSTCPCISSLASGARKGSSTLAIDSPFVERFNEHSLEGCLGRQKGYSYIHRRGLGLPWFQCPSAQAGTCSQHTRRSGSYSSLAGKTHLDQSTSG